MLRLVIWKTPARHPTIPHTERMTVESSKEISKSKYTRRIRSCLQYMAARMLKPKPNRRL